MDEGGTPREGAGERGGRGRAVAWVAALLALLASTRLLPIDRWFDELEAGVASLGALGPLAYGLLYVVAALLFVPGSAVTLLAGPLFGLGLGTAVVSVASTTAAALAFLIARHAARGAVERHLLRRGGGERGAGGRLEAIDTAIGRGGWRVVALLRLSPLVPFSLGNYLYGLTSIRFWPYVAASWLGMLPGTFLYVYLGYAGARGLEAASGGGEGRTAQTALLVAGLVATAAVTWYVGRLAQRAVRESSGPGEPGSPRTEGLS